jgi:branched-chain amino acid transport system ATP-binding protein
MNEPTAQLSYGRQRMLEIALAIATKPRVLLLDEPAAGVPESERRDILAAVASLPRQVTVLLIEHDMDLVFSFADRISVMVSGALLVEGTPNEVARYTRQGGVSGGGGHLLIRHEELGRLKAGRARIALFTWHACGNRVCAFR